MNVLNWIEFTSYVLIFLGVLGLLLCFTFKHETKILGSVLITNKPGVEYHGGYVLFNSALTADQVRDLYNSHVLSETFDMAGYWYSDIEKEMPCSN